MKKLLRLLAVLLVAASLAACSQTSSSDGTTTEKADSADSGEDKGSQAASEKEGDSSAQSQNSEDLPETLSFSVMNWLLNDHYATDLHAEWMKQMEEYLGVKLDITWNNISYREHADIAKVYMASGDFDDIFIAEGLYQINELGAAGLIEDITDYPDSIPYYDEWLNDNYNRERLALDGESIYGFSVGEQGYHWGSQQVSAYREDIFRKHEIKIPETMDDFYDAAKTLKELYPDSFPIGGGLDNGNGYNLYSTFLNINRTHYTFYYNGSEYVFPPIDDAEAFKETLVYLNKLYSEGLVDPEYRTQTSEQGYERMLNGRNFMVPDYWTSENARVNGVGVDTDVRWVYAARVKSFKGELGWKPGSQWEGYKLTGGDMSVVSSKSEHKDLLIKLLDYQFSPEMLDLANWGIEGVTYNIVDGQKEFIPEIREAEAPRAAAEPYGVIVSATNFLGIRAPKERQAWSNVFSSFPGYANGEFFDYDDIWKFTDEFESGKDSVFPNDIAPPVILTQDEMDIRSNIYTPLETELHEAIMGFISGSRDLSGYDDWVESLKNIGDYEALKTLYNEKYEQFN